MKHILNLFTLLLATVSFAQHNEITPENAYFGIDLEKKLIVWNTSHIDSIPWPISSQNTMHFDTIKVDFLKPFRVSSQDTMRHALVALDTFKIYTTSHPIIKINPFDSIVNEPKRLARFSYADFKKQRNDLIGIELRGNSALRYPKKSYDLEIRQDSLPEESKEAKLSGMRRDDDWQLNSLYNEPLKLRSHFANRLWLDIHEVQYSEKEKKAKSGIGVAYVEVFLGTSYRGLYVLNEQIDRKQLKLQKIDSLGNVQGELFKATSYQSNTSFKAAPDFRNIFPHWGGFEVKYPYENYEAHWGDLHSFVNFVATSNDTVFTQQIEQHLNIDNAIDYFLFTNLLRATDNLGKNYFLARYERGAPYFFVPWDLDGVLGIIQDGKRIATIDDILSNHLFDRLKEVDPSNYKERVSQRWHALRKEAFSSGSLHQKLDDCYQEFTNSGLYERENATWPHDLSREDHYKYMVSWLEARLTFLDDYFTEH